MLSSSLWITASWLVQCKSVPLCLGKKKKKKQLFFNKVADRICSEMASILLFWKMTGFSYSIRAITHFGSHVTLKFHLRVVLLLSHISIASYYCRSWTLSILWFFMLVILQNLYFRGEENWLSCIIKLYNTGTLYDIETLVLYLLNLWMACKMWRESMFLIAMLVFIVLQGLGWIKLKVVVWFLGCFFSKSGDLVYSLIFSNLELLSELWSY